jgi:UDP-glucuronate 4-epimerase
MRILVTGVAGFIGSRVAQKCLENNYEVTGIDSLSNLLYSDEIKKARLKNLSDSKNFSFISADLNDYNLENLLQGIDFVINEAGLPGQALSWNALQQYIDSNFVAVAKLIKAAQKTGVKRFLQASTSSVYGELAVGNESQAKNPISPYGVTKLSAENLLQAYFKNFDFPVVTLRYFSVYGPDQRPDMAIHKLLTSVATGGIIKMNSGGNQIRDFTYVDDIVDGTFAALSLGTNGEAYNLSSGNPVPMNNVISIVEKVTNKKLKIDYNHTQVGDQFMTFGDNGKAKASLGFNPRTPLEIGIENQFKFLISS